MRRLCRFLALCLSITAFLMVGSLFVRPFWLRTVLPLPSIASPQIPAIAEAASEPLSPPRLIISKIHLEAPIVTGVEASDQGVYMQALKNGVALAKESATLNDAIGNSFLFGHSSQFGIHASAYDTVFVSLPSMQEGDVIQVAHDGVVDSYTVTVSRSIKATDVHYLANDGSRKLTLATCWPIGTNLKRWVVQAVKSS